MNARDGHPTIRTHIPGPRSRVYTTTKKNPNRRATSMTPLNLLKTPLPPKPKESAQPPELKTSKQTRTTLRWTKLLVYLTSILRPNYPQLELNPTDRQVKKASQESPNTFKYPQQCPKLTYVSILSLC